MSRWAKGRLRAYESSLAHKLPYPIAVLTIPRLHLRVPIFDGTDEMTLNRGIGRIAGTAMPGEGGNLAIAGHRDGFFRGLKDIAIGDQVEITSPVESETYIVDSTEIVTPSDVRVLQAGAIHTVTLITCYPFYFVGDAPKRFVVKASLIHRSPLQATLRQHGNHKQDKQNSRNERLNAMSRTRVSFSTEAGSFLVCMLASGQSMLRGYCDVDSVP